MKRHELQNNLAMTVLLISAGMLFATLFMGYAVYRSSAVAWPPMGMNSVSWHIPLFSTIVIGVSSWFCYQVKKAVQVEDFKSARMNLKLTILLGLGFMVSQLWLWGNLKASGLLVGSGVFASILYGFTWIHAAHVVLGLMSLLYLHWSLGPKGKNKLQRTINVEKIWHFLGVVWIVMFIGLFVF